MKKHTRVTPQGLAFKELVTELAFAHFRLRATAQHLTESLGLTPGKLSMLRELKAQGARTVPQIARERPVPRQPVQRMADELAADGLVTFGPNPRHARSRLLTITGRGEKLVDRAEALQDVWASEVVGDEIGVVSLRRTTSLIRRIRELVVP